MKLHKICTFLTVVFCTNLLWAGMDWQLPENHSVNGGVTIIPFDSKREPNVYYKDSKVAIIPSHIKNQWLIVVGIPLDAKDSIQNLRVSQPQKGVIPFHISEKFYNTQRLTIANQRKVDPYAKDRSRINQESEEQRQLFSHFTSHNPFQEGFIAPSQGPISSLFGLKRVYNGKPRAPHSGLDVASPDKAPVKATSGGTVVSAKDYFFTGNTVIIDHGMGLFSLYAHLSSMNVKKGEVVKQGQVIGKIGATGRVTGPHLHWSMILNGTLVDPLLFVPARDIRKKSA